MATKTATTVGTILQIISDLRGESSTNTDASRIRAISRGYNEFGSREHWRVHLIKDQTLTGDGLTRDFTIGSTSYPMRMKGLSEVFVGGTTEDKRHRILDFHQYKSEFNANNAALLAYEWYDQVNDLWKMHINPIPANGDTITYSYFMDTPDLMATTDKVICPNSMIIAKLALADIYHGEDELQKELQQRQEVEQLIADVIGDEDAPAVNQAYAMTAIENKYPRSGIGNY